MDETPKPRRFSKRPLLVASIGIAAISIGAAGGFACGNLMAPSCPDGGTDRATCFGQQPTVDGGTDGGTDGGLGGDS